MTELSISDARKQFTSLDELLRVNPVIWVMRHNKRAFAVVETEYLNAVMAAMELVKNPDSVLLLAEAVMKISAAPPRTT